MILYETLEVSQIASPEEITTNYKRLTFRYHPDRNPGHIAKFTDVANAYRILNDRKCRYFYDTFGEKSLIVLNDSRVCELFVNIYDRQNLHAISIAALFFVIFLLLLPYLLLIRDIISYTAIFLPLYLSNIILCYPFFRAGLFLRNKPQYQNENFLYFMLIFRASLITLQIFCITIFYDNMFNSSLNVYVLIVPVILLGIVNFLEEFFVNISSPYRNTRKAFKCASSPMIRLILVYLVFTDVDLYFKCFVPTFLIIQSGIENKCQGGFLVMILLPVNFLIASCVMVLKNYSLIVALIPAIVFDFAIVFGISLIFLVYRNTIGQNYRFMPRLLELGV